MKLEEKFLENYENLSEFYWKIFNHESFFYLIYLQNSSKTENDQDDKSALKKDGQHVAKKRAEVHT